jgi:hypothetical protein
MNPTIYIKKFRLPEKLWLRWEGNDRRNCLLLLNIGRERRLAQYKNVWRPSADEDRAECRLSGL